MSVFLRDRNAHRISVGNVNQLPIICTLHADGKFSTISERQIPFVASLASLCDLLCFLLLLVLFFNWGGGRLKHARHRPGGDMLQFHDDLCSELLEFPHWVRFLFHWSKR